MALFWHGHFATAENKVRDYRKMLEAGRHCSSGTPPATSVTGSSPSPRTRRCSTTSTPGLNVKGAANENFAREVMELFTMGVGNYSEEDVREAARAFTGWNFENLDFVVNPALHDDDEKTFLGRTGNFDGVDVLRIILEAAGHGRIHRGQDLPILRVRRAVGGPPADDETWKRSSETTTTSSGRC